MSADGWKKVLQIDALVIFLFCTIGTFYFSSGPTGVEAMAGGLIEQECEAAMDSGSFWFFTMNSVPLLVFGVALLVFSRKKGWL